MLTKYIYGSNIIFLCYDVTEPQSFVDLEDWMSLVLKTIIDPITGKLKQVYVYLVGNKIDLIGLRMVSNEKHKEFVVQHKLAGEFLLSAHNGDNVLRTVHKIAAKASGGAELSEYDLQFLDKPVRAYTLAEDKGAIEARTKMADEIEKEDLKNEDHKRMQEVGCRCNLM